MKKGSLMDRVFTENSKENRAVLWVLRAGMIAVVIVLLTCSCMTTKTPVGNYREAPGEEYTYDKTKQIYLFWGCVPLGRATANTPDTAACEIITRRNLGDVLITCITGGVVSTYTIKVNSKK